MSVRIGPGGTEYIAGGTRYTGSLAALFAAELGAWLSGHPVRLGRMTLRHAAEVDRALSTLEGSPTLGSREGDDFLRSDDGLVLLMSLAGLGHEPPGGWPAAVAGASAGERARLEALLSEPWGGVLMPPAASDPMPGGLRPWSLFAHADGTPRDLGDVVAELVRRMPHSAVAAMEGTLWLAHARLMLEPRPTVEGETRRLLGAAAAAGMGTGDAP